MIAVTAAAAKVSMDFEGKYDLVMTDEEYMKKSPWFVHSFWAIGMPDPFPDESTVLDKENECVDDKIPFTKDKLIYPQNRYSEAHSPAIIYIPSR